MKYLVLYSVSDTYETYVEIDDNSSDPRADIEDYLNDNAGEEGFDRKWRGGGIVLERHYPRANANA